MIYRVIESTDDTPLPVQGSCLLAQGGEELLKRVCIDRLRGIFLQDDDAFNIERLDVAERWDGVADTAEQVKREKLTTRVDRILALARELPFFGGGRFVIVMNIDLLSADQQKKLAAGLASIPPMNHLLMITGEGKAKVGHDLYKAIERAGTVYDCSPLTNGEAGAWVRGMLAGWEQTIDPPALSLLITRAGSDLRRLRIEIEKLSLFAGDQGRIRETHVEMMTPKLTEESVFHLADAVGTRNAAQALAVLRDLLERQFESPYRIFPMLIRQFRLIWLTKAIMEAGWKPNQDLEKVPAARELLPKGVAVSTFAGWMGSKLVAQARQFSWPQLREAYQALVECDMSSKGIEGAPHQEMELAMEMLCARLCRKPSGRYERAGYR